MGRPEIVVLWVSPFVFLAISSFLYGSVSSIPTSSLNQDDLQNFNDPESWDLEDDKDSSIEDYLKFILEERKGLKVDGTHDENGKEDDPHLYNSLRYFPHVISATPEESVDEKSKVPSPFSFTTSHPTRHRLARPRLNENVFSSKVITKDAQPEEISFDFNSDRKWALSPLDHLVVKQSQLGKSTEWKKLVEEKGKMERLRESVTTTSLHHHKVAVGHVKEDATISGVKGHHAKINNLFPSTSFRLGPIPGHIKDISSSRHRLRPFAEVRKGDETTKVKSHDFRKFPYQVPFPYVIRKRNDTQSDSRSGHGHTLSNGILLQRRNRSRRNALSTEPVPEEATVAEREALVQSQDENNSTESHAESVEHSEGIDSKENVKNSLPPPTNPLEALQRLTRLLEKMVRELSQYRQKFTLRLIRMTEREDIDQMQDIMKDFDVSPTKPIFFIAGGIKFPTGTRTETIETVGNVSPPTVPTKSNQEISGLAAAAIPTTGDSLQSTPETSTTSLPVEPETKSNETGSDLVISRHNTNSSEIEPNVESLPEAQSIRHTRSIPELHEFGINFDFFPIPGRQARTESPHDEHDDDDDDDDDELDEEEEEYRKKYRPWRDRESQHVKIGSEPSFNSLPPPAIDQSHTKHKDDDVTSIETIQKAISTFPQTLTSPASSISPVHLVDSAIPVDDSITMKTEYEKSNDQDANLEHAAGVNTINFSSSTTTTGKPYFECTSTPPPVHNERKGSEEENTHLTPHIGEERAIREPTENLHLVEQSLSEEMNKEQVSQDKLEKITPLLVSTDGLLNTENGQELVSAPGASELLFDKQTFSSLPVTSSNLEQSSPFPVTNNEHSEAYETYLDKGTSQNSFNSGTVGDKHGIIMSSTGKAILINSADTISPQSSSTIDEVSRPDHIIGEGESKEPKENTLTLEVDTKETQIGVDEETPHSLDVITHQGENNHVGSLTKANSPLSEDSILEKNDAQNVALPTPKVDIPLTSEDAQRRTLSLETATVNNIVGGGDIDKLSQTDSKPTSLLESSNAPFPVETEGSTVAADKTEFASGVLGEIEKEEIQDKETFTLGETQPNLVLEESVTTNKVGKNDNERNMEKEEIAVNQPTFVGQTNSEEIQIIDNSTSLDKTYPSIDFHQTKEDVAVESQNDVKNAVLAQSELPETAENTDEKHTQESIALPIVQLQSVINPTETNVSPVDSVEENVGNIIEEKSNQQSVREVLTSDVNVGETLGVLIESASAPLPVNFIITKIMGTSEHVEGVLPETEVVKESEATLNSVVFPSIDDKPDKTPVELTDLNVLSESEILKDKRKIESNSIISPNSIPTDVKISPVFDEPKPVVKPEDLVEIPEKVDVEKIQSDLNLAPVDAFQVVSDVPSESVSDGADLASEIKVISTPDIIPDETLKEVDTIVSQPRIPEIRDVSKEILSTSENLVGLKDVKKVELSTATAAVIEVPESPQLVNDPVLEPTFPTPRPIKTIQDIPVEVDGASPTVDVTPEVVPIANIPGTAEAEKVSLVTNESPIVPVSKLPETYAVFEGPQESEVVSQFSTESEPHLASGDMVLSPFFGIPQLTDYISPEQYPVETPEIYNSNPDEIVDPFPSVPVAHPFDIIPSLPTGEDVISSLPPIDPNFGIRPIITQPHLQIPGFRPSLPIRPQPEYIAYISQGVDSVELRTPQYPVVIPSPPVLSAYSPAYFSIKKEQQLQNFFSGMMFRKEPTN